MVDIPPAVPGGIDTLFAVAHMHTRHALFVCEVDLHDETCVEIFEMVFCSVFLF